MTKSECTLGKLGQVIQVSLKSLLTVEYISSGGARPLLQGRLAKCAEQKSGVSNFTGNSFLEMGSLLYFFS